MQIALAYLAIMLLWSTTPLAIQWSGQGPGYLFGLLARMSIGLLCTVALQILFRVPLPIHKKALTTYVYGGLGIYGAMFCVYWSATQIPSSWISILFGLAPMITSLMSYYLLDEKSFTAQKSIAMVLGLTGLGVMFLSSMDVSAMAMLGVLMVVVSATIHSGSAVMIKRVNAQLPALASVTGSLLIAVSALFLSWLILDGQWHELTHDKSYYAILYLGIIATGGGFSLYYFVLKHVSATRLAMLALVSPVIAIWLGISLNGEILETRTIVGTGLVLFSLFLHEFKLPVNRLTLFLYPAVYRK